MELDLDVLRSQVEAHPHQTTPELAVTLGEEMELEMLKYYHYLKEEVKKPRSNTTGTSPYDCSYCGAILCGEQQELEVDGFRHTEQSDPGLRQVDYMDEEEEEVGDHGGHDDTTRI
uniref:C2H2-type domain-containing protein n=1 Tax=Haemonchus contortus TaxID=6289 RepID=A0A7I4YJX0_HAECO